MKEKIYHTGGCAELTAFLSQNPDRQFSTEELCRAVNGDSTHGKSTVYRHLTQLCRDEVVRKFRSEERNCSLYQYVGEHCDCAGHLHEKCTRCGAIYHLDCHDSSDFIKHLLEEHGFAVDCGQSILYGLCADCRKSEGGRA